MKNYHVANRLLGAVAALLMTIGLPPGGPVVSAGGFREEALADGKIGFVFANKVDLKALLSKFGGEAPRQIRATLRFAALGL